jgi:5-methylcytosine-specific restriction endonuclease McrA
MSIESPVLVPAPPNVAALERLGDEIAELSAHLEAATGRLLTLIREFDARGGWNTGFRSCAEWLGWRVGLDLHTARERVRVARALGDLPLLAGALARGELSYAKVRALTRVATPETEARLLAVGRAGTAAHVERIVHGWRRVDRQAEAREATRQHAGRALHVFTDDDGTVVVRGRLTPEQGALLRRALDAAREALYQRRRGAAPAPAATDPTSEVTAPTLGVTDPTPVVTDRAQGFAEPAQEPPTWGQQQADALTLLAETALHHELDRGGPGERYQVVVHVDAEVLMAPDGPGQSVLEEGSHVPAGTSRRLACDASRVVMAHGPDGQVMEVGARTRTIPPALRRALLHRDQTCRFPGCPVRVAEGHHVQHWAEGGATTLSNLVLLCRRHHRAVHEEGYRIAREPDGSVQVTRPDGRLLPAVPPPAPVPGDPVEALRAEHAAQGMHLTSRTTCPLWLGERLDLVWALDVLHPLAARCASLRPDLPGPVETRPGRTSSG